MTALFATTVASGTSLGTATITAANNTLTFGAAHGLVDGQVVITSSPSAGTIGVLVPGAPYYVANSTATTMQLRPAPGSPIVLFSTDGTAIVDQAESVYDPLGMRKALGGLLYKGRASSVSGRFGARPGVLVNTASTEVTISAFTVTVGNLNVVLNPPVPSQNGPYICAISGSSLTVSAADSQPRIDIVAARIRDNAVDSTGFAIADAYIITGVAAGLPSAPAVPDNSFRLAQVNVPASGGGNPTLTFDADYTVAAGGILPVRNSTGYPSEVQREGMYIDDAATDTLYRWSGSAWVPVASNAAYNSIKRINTTIRTTNTTTFSAETSINTVTATLKTGKVYRVTWKTNGSSTVLNDRMRFRIREDTISGNQLDLAHVTAEAATVDFPVRLETEYTALADGPKTFVGTCVRQAGSGNLAVNHNANQPGYLYVDEVR